VNSRNACISPLSPPCDKPFDYDFSNSQWRLSRSFWTFSTASTPKIRGAVHGPMNKMKSSYYRVAWILLLGLFGLVS
jgi:hypothetical protein